MCKIIIFTKNVFHYMIHQRKMYFEALKYVFLFILPFKKVF